ncbi:hypothetical protein H4R19_003956 [Coemansia spiralis]|nr:hypothetical protein H4R19_003956 [Coemansia spiralis]
MAQGLTVVATLTNRLIVKRYTDDGLRQQARQVEVQGSIGGQHATKVSEELCSVLGVVPAFTIREVVLWGIQLHMVGAPGKGRHQVANAVLLDDVEAEQDGRAALAREDLGAKDKGMTRR